MLSCRAQAAAETGRATEFSSTDRGSTPSTDKLQPAQQVHPSLLAKYLQAGPRLHVSVLNSAILEGEVCAINSVMWLA